MQPLFDAWLQRPGCRLAFSTTSKATTKCYAVIFWHAALHLLADLQQVRSEHANRLGALDKMLRLYQSVLGLELVPGDGKRGMCGTALENVTWSLGFMLSRQATQTFFCQHHKADKA